MTTAERICVVIGRTRHKMMAIEIQEAVRQGARLLELRLDFLARGPDIKRLLANRPCPLVATVRRTSDGGRFNGPEEARLMLLRQAIVAGFDWIDLETDVADVVRRFGPTKRIVSYHNFNETPADLRDIYERMCAQDADVVKLAVTAQTPADNLRLLEILRTATKPTVGHCMGDLGFASRLLALKYNPPFIYAAFNKERGIAPGLPSFDDLTRVYGCDRINADTAVYGVIGDPIGHSLSPLVHNAAFRKLGINALYLPFRVPRGDLPAALAAWDGVPVRGYSVTIPHKEAAAQAADERDGTVTSTHAANTLIRRKQGGFSAANTDFTAIIESLQAHPLTGEDGQQLPWSGRRALLLGAGGAARAAAHALRSIGLTVTIAARTLERAETLAREVDGKAVAWDARHAVECDLVVNGTPVGMHPDVDETPLHHSFLKPGLVVFDTIYTPETTLLIKEARARGCAVITGVDMFIRQAGRQFAMFTGQEPPIELMQTILRRALSPVHHNDEDEGH